MHAESENNGAGGGTQTPEETAAPAPAPPAPEAGNNTVVAAGSAVAGVLLFGLTRVRVNLGKTGQQPRRHPQARLSLTSTREAAARKGCSMCLQRGRWKSRNEAVQRLGSDATEGEKRRKL